MRLGCVRILLLCLLSACGLGCEREQWLLLISTDAPIPQLGDRLLVEFTMADQRPCKSCRRIISVGSDDRWPVSIGVPPLPDVAVHVRARLYLDDHTDAAGLPISAFLDRTGWLAATVPVGVEPVELALSASCFGVSSEVRENGEIWTCDPASGRLEPEHALLPISSREGSLRPGAFDPLPELLRKCPSTEQVPSGMVCVPGGLFVLGGIKRFPVNSELESVPERLVLMKRFAIDQDEYKVRDLYAFVLANGLSGLPAPTDERCTHLGTIADETNEKPANCVVGKSLAEQICSMRGGRLPTEAEWEYAAGNLFQETRFPWGEDEKICEHAIVERGTYFGESMLAESALTRCRYVNNAKQPAGAQAGGHPGDITKLGIRNLMGNITEWVVDEPAPYDAPCWTPQGKNWLLHPRCTASPPGVRTKAVARGNNFVGPVTLTEVITRRQYPQLGGSHELGFRCVRDL